MGILNKAKGNSAGTEAREAFTRGDYVFVFKAIEANVKSMTTGPMPGMAEQIQAIEAEGWALTNMAAAESKVLSGERIALILMFRRR
ncbi:hypothetical protein [Kitasatospora sp. HPMI-4]|uniref:hypothetical protein n=1 Tax=Kitasatospora sp. HPMI-4 TaxID=3448443 RepID=UPI003F1B4261